MNVPQTSREEDGLPDDEEYNIPIHLRQPGDSETEPPSPVGDLRLNLDMDLNKYRNMKEADFNNLADVVARKKIIGMIKEHECLWAFKRVCVPLEIWETFAIEHFLRTGNMSHDTHIRKVWGSAKKELLEMLTQSIQSKDTEEETEEQLRSWDLYRPMSFYRVVTYEYEMELRKKVKNLLYDKDVVEDLSAFTDLVTSVQEVKEDDGTVHHKLVREPPLVLDETDTGTTRKIRAPLRKPGLSMTLQEYRALRKEQFEERMDVEILKLIISVIEEFPILWDREKVRAPRLEYERMAIELYLRTEVLLSVEHVWTVFNETKERLRMELQMCKMRNLSLHDTELHLDHWELYQQIKFFREAMMEFDIDVNQKGVFEDELLLYIPGEEGTPGLYNAVMPESGPLVLDSQIVNMNPQNDGAQPPVDNNPPLFPKIPVPDIIDGLTMTLDDYKKVKNFVKRNDLESTKKIIAILETHKELWEQKGVAMPLEKWQILAVDVYLRTSYRLKVPFIREMWKKAKDQLRCKVRPTLMAKDEKAYKAAMNRLHNWELYEQTKFFREVMKEYEEETKKKHQGFAYNVELVDAQDPFADIIFEGKYTSDPQMKEYLLQYPLAATVEMKPDVGQNENEEEEEEIPEELQKIRIPGPRPGVQMTVDEYRAMEIEEFENRTDSQAKKWVLCLIEKQPALWYRRNMKTTVEQWEELAVEFYLRTGSSMSVPHIRSIWKNLKEALRKRLSKPLDSARIEEELSKWEFYLQMEFYRKVMKEVEDARRKKFDGVAHNEEILNDATAFEDVFVTKIVHGTGILPINVKQEFNVRDEDRVETKPLHYHLQDPVEQQEDNQWNLLEDYQDEEMIESPGPQDAAQLDPVTEEAAFVLGRLFDIGQEGNGVVQNLVTAFVEVIDRPGLEDTPMDQIWRSMREVVGNDQEGGKENRPA